MARGRKTTLPVDELRYLIEERHLTHPEAGVVLGLTRSQVANACTYYGITRTREKPSAEEMLKDIEASLPLINLRLRGAFVAARYERELVTRVRTLYGGYDFQHYVWDGVRCVPGRSS